MPTLHWSSLVECMQRLSCWPWTNSSYVCIAVCDSELLLMFDTVGPMSPYHVILPSCTMFLSKYTNYTPVTINVNNGRASIFVVGWMYGGTGAVLALDKQRVRLYCCCVWAWTWSYYWCFYTVWGCNFTHVMLQNIHYNDDDDSVLIFACWMYGTGIMLALGRAESTFVLAAAYALDLIYLKLLLLMFNAVSMRS